MAQAVMENGAGHIHAVEISKDSIDATAKNLEEANLRSYVTLHYGNSADPHILSKLPKSELIFIDGDHSYEGAKRDIENYKGILSDDGFMVLHDTTKIMDLHKLVDELCEQNGLKVFTFATSDGDGISLVRKIRNIGVYPFH